MVMIEVNNSECKTGPLPKSVAGFLSKSLSYPSDPKINDPNSFASMMLAQRADNWDGWLRLGRLRSVSATEQVFTFPTGLLHYAIDLLKQCGIESVLNDSRKRPNLARDSVFPEVEPLPLRDYQLDAVAASMEAGRGVLCIPPRGGKTMTAIEITRQLGLPVLWLAPTSNVCEQTVAAFDRWLGKGVAYHVTSSTVRHHLEAPVLVCCFASASDFSPEVLATRKVLIGDEQHHFSAKTLSALTAKLDHIYYRFGLTGTFFRSNGDDLALHAILSNVIYSVSTSFLVERGYTVGADVAYLNTSSWGKTNQRDYKKLQRSALWLHEERNGTVAKAASMLAALGKKVLILVSSKEQGDQIATMLRDEMSLGKVVGMSPAEFVSTNKNKPLIRKILDSFRDPEGSVSVLTGTSMVCEGTDLPTADALIYAYGGKAEVSHTQAYFRVCTAVPGKRKALILDFNDAHAKVLAEHAEQRLETYLKEPTFDVFQLDDPKLLGQFLAERGF